MAPQSQPTPVPCQAYRGPAVPGRCALTPHMPPTAAAAASRTPRISSANDFQGKRSNRWPNSLFLVDASLFFRKNSLIAFLGNSPESPYNAACWRPSANAIVPKPEKFPVKFPVSREFAWRSARSALRRQPAISAFAQPPQERGNGPEIRAFRLSDSVSRSRFPDPEVEIAESLRPCPRIFPFCGDYRGRLV